MQHENTSDIEKKLKDLEKKEQAVARKLDTGFWYVFTASLSVFMVLFYLYNTAISPASAQYHRGIYVLITFVLVFLFYPGSKWSNEHRPTVFDILLALLAAFVTGYWMVEFEALNYRMGAETTTDFVVSTLGVLISLEVARRVLGWTLPLVGIVFLLYCYLGPYLPEVIAHRGFSIERTLNHVYLKQEGVFGIMANVLVTYVILFIFFGSFLKKSGAGQFFLDLPMALFGRRIGGPAKVSVIASGFFGSVSGSAIANTATTGTFTIPLMKRAGFKPHIAGGIEPAASVGGMFMPPIMGAGGFLMAEMTNTPYVEIMKMAVFPAILYFISVLVMVHFEAKRHGLRGVEDESAPKAKDILKKEWFMVVPLLLIIVLMLWGYSPGYSAVIATASCVLVSWFTKDKRMGPKEICRGDRYYRGVHRLDRHRAPVFRHHIQPVRWNIAPGHNIGGPGQPDPGHGRSGHRLLSHRGRPGCSGHEHHAGHAPLRGLGPGRAERTGGHLDPAGLAHDGLLVQSKLQQHSPGLPGGLHRSSHCRIRSLEDGLDSI
jgi:TRAP transporter 4TM/12TM fusion protein